MCAWYPVIAPGSANRSAYASVMVASSPRQRCVARPERTLHQNRINPAPELEADGAQHPDRGKAERAMQADRRHGLAAADDRDHLAVAEFGRALDHPRQQRAADAASDLAGGDVDRILDREPVADARSIRPGVTITHHRAGALGDEI